MGRFRQAFVGAQRLWKFHQQTLRELRQDPFSWQLCPCLTSVPHSADVDSKEYSFDAPVMDFATKNCI